MRQRWLVKVLFFAGLVLLWELLARLAIWPPYMFPSPLEVASSVADGFADGTFVDAIGRSMGRIALGYGLSLFVGLPLGLALGRSRLLRDTLGTLALGMQALPSICWLPLGLLWFGLSEAAIMFIVVMGAIFSISLSTADGVRNTAPLYLKAARTLGARGFFLYSRVILPSALPAIVSGMKLGWTFAWRSLMAGELLYVSGGLGQLLAMGRELNDMSRVIAVMLTIVVLGLVVDRLVFRRLEARVRERWGFEDGMSADGRQP
mgnify:CR=1 FL=1